MAAIRRAIAGIGSSKTPDAAGAELTRIVSLHAAAGFWLYSGGAWGADSFSERGAAPDRKIIIYGNPRHKQGDRYESIPPQDAHHVLLKPGPLKDKATEVMSQCVDASHWANIVKKGDFVANLYARNTMQVVSPDLKSPVDLVVCWANPDPSDGTVQGGTKGAIRVAERLHIPWYNLAVKEHRERLAAYIAAGFPERTPAELAKTYAAMMDFGLITREEVLARGIELPVLEQRTVESNALDDLDLFGSGRAAPRAAQTPTEEPKAERESVFARAARRREIEEADRPHIEAQANAWMGERQLSLRDGGHMFPNEYDGRFPGIVIGKTDVHYAFALGLNPPREVYYVSRDHLEGDVAVGKIARVSFAPGKRTTIEARPENAPAIFPVTVEKHKGGFRRSNNASGQIGEWIGLGNDYLNLPYSPLSGGLDVRDRGAEYVKAEYRKMLDEHISDGDERMIDELDRLAELAITGPVTLVEAPNDGHGSVVAEFVQERARALAAQLSLGNDQTQDGGERTQALEPLFDQPAPIPQLPAAGQWHRNWFSNMIPFEKPLVHEGISYPSAEHFYQALKSNDVAVRRQIADMPNPGKVKQFARTIALRPDWEQVKVDVMRMALRHKFAEGTKAREDLLATGRTEIVEWNNWGDRVWGRTIADGAGQNQLGVMLMVLRAEIVHERAMREERIERGVNLLSPNQRVGVFGDGNDRSAAQDAWAEVALGVRSGDRDIVVTNGRVFRIGPEDGNRLAGGRGYGGQGWTVRYPDGTERYTTNLWDQGRIPERYLDTLPQTGAIYQDPFRDHDPATLGWSEHNGKRYQNQILPTSKEVLIQPGPVGTDSREILKWDDPRAVAFLEREMQRMAEHHVSEIPGGRIIFAAQGTNVAYDGPLVWARETMFLQRVGNDIVVHRDQRTDEDRDRTLFVKLMENDRTYRVEYPAQSITPLREHAQTHEQTAPAVAQSENARTLDGGNLFNSSAEAHVNTVNLVGVMGKGIAKDFKRLYPAMFERYRAKCASKELQPGVMDVFDRGAGQQPRYIINFPTKRDWRDDSRIEDVKIGLEALVERVNTLGIKSIAIPPLGCGNGNLNWADVEPLIRDAATRMAYTQVEIYVPARQHGHTPALPLTSNEPHITNGNGLNQQAANPQRRALGDIDPKEVGLHPITVGNDNRGEKGEYIGRGGRNRYPRSPLANPFEIGKPYNESILREAGVSQDAIAKFTERFRGKVFERGDTIDLYRAWLAAKIKSKDPAVMTELNRLTDVASKQPLQVVCHCAPHACHGDVVRQAVILTAQRRMENAKTNGVSAAPKVQPQQLRSVAGGMGR